MKRRAQASSATAAQGTSFASRAGVTARWARSAAARAYCSAASRLTLVVSALLSKPSARASGGKPSVGRPSSPSSAATVASYSSRVSLRRNDGPGSTALQALPVGPAGPVGAVAVGLLPDGPDRAGGSPGSG